MRRAGAEGEILIRADSGVYSGKVITYLEKAGCLFSIAVAKHKRMAERIAEIPESAWRAVPDHPETGVGEPSVAPGCSESAAERAGGAIPVHRKRPLRSRPGVRAAHTAADGDFLSSDGDSVD